MRGLTREPLYSKVFLCAIIYKLSTYFNQILYQQNKLLYTFLIILRKINIIIFGIIRHRYMAHCITNTFYIFCYYFKSIADVTEISHGDFSAKIAVGNLEKVRKAASPKDF